jgi:hypothetical protein
MEYEDRSPNDDVIIEYVRSDMDVNQLMYLLRCEDVFIYDI